jgi:hypothetical protein
VRRADASTPPVSPEARLERYKRSWTAVQKSWAALCNPHAIQHTSAFQQQLIHHISAQTRLLLDRPASRLCLEYTLRTRVVPELGKIARNSPSSVASAVVRCLVSMIDAADEDFLADESVCGSISELAGSFHAGLDDEYRASLMELLFNVAATTKVRRGLLGLWFHLARDVGSVSETSTATDVPSSVVRLLIGIERLSYFLCVVGECSRGGTDWRFCQDGATLLYRTGKPRRRARRMDPLKRSGYNDGGGVLKHPFLTKIANNLLVSEHHTLNSLEKSSSSPHQKEPSQLSSQQTTPPQPSLQSQTLKNTNAPTPPPFPAR